MGFFRRGSSGGGGASLTKYPWVNADVAALAGSTDSIVLVTLPARTVVLRAYMIVETMAGGVGVLTASVGRAGAYAYTDYLVAANAKAAATYGDEAAELGFNLASGFGDIVDLSNPVDIHLQFDAGSDALADVTGSTGAVYLETTVLP